MENVQTFQFPSTAQKPSAGAQKEDSSAAGHSCMVTAHIKQPPLQSDANQTVATRPSTHNQRGRGRGRFNRKPRSHEIYNKNKVFEEIFTKSYYQKILQNLSC